MRLLLCILSVSLALGACSSTSTGTSTSTVPGTSPGAGATQSLEGTSWRLAAFQSNDDGVGTLQPGTPDQYTLTFGKDGRLTAKLDCNRGSGPWQAVATDAASGTVSLGPVATTRMMCPPSAIGARLTGDLAALGSYRIEGTRLTTSLPADAGVYLWERVAP